jgi:hypothetical protein
VHLKSPIGFKYPNLLIRSIRCTGFYNAKQQQSMAALWWVGVVAVAVMVVRVRAVARVRARAVARARAEARAVARAVVRAPME